MIDWFLTLPKGLEIAFRQELVNFETEKAMSYVTSIERLGREEGRQEGWQEGRQEGWQEGRQEGGVSVVLRLARKRFPDLTPTIEQQIRRLPVELVESLGEALLDLRTLSDLERWLSVRSSERSQI